jgi:hypothetical protein
MSKCFLYEEYMLTSSIFVLQPKCNYILKKYYIKDKAVIGNVVSATQTGVTPDFLMRLILDLLYWWDIWHDCPCHSWASGTIGASSCADRYGTTGPGGPEPGKPVALLGVAPQGLA